MYRKNEGFIFNIVELMLMASLNFLGITIVAFLTTFMTRFVANDTAINIAMARNARLWY